MSSSRRQCNGAVSFLLLCLLVVVAVPKAVVAIRELTDPPVFSFSEAPDYRNGEECQAVTAAYRPAVKSRKLRDDPLTAARQLLVCDPSLVHVAMTLDSEYLRGTIAAVHSVLKHTSCPESVFLHFITLGSDRAGPRALTGLVRSTFPSLHFKVHVFNEERVAGLISASIRDALESPLNFARNYLGEILDACVGRVIYLDSDLVLVDDILKLWSTPLTDGRVIGAPEYCHANFTSYFTDSFWSDAELHRSAFPTRKKRPCYFNTGVMVIDLVRWREGNFRRQLEKWMNLQKKHRIYDLGSLPPFLLVFAGDLEPIDHRWNQHGLGGHNVKGSCRSLHPGPVSLLHWSGKGKPWNRLDENAPCPVDYLWEPYDLYRRHEGGESSSGYRSSFAASCS